MSNSGSKRAKAKAPPAGVSHADVPVAVFATPVIEPVAPPDAADISSVALAAADGDVAVVEAITLSPEAFAPTGTPNAADPAPTADKEAMMTDLNNVAENTQAQASAMFADAKTRSEDMMGKSARMFEDMNAFTKGNVEAIVESSKIAAKAFETLGQDVAENARKGFEEMTAAVKAMTSLKSPTEFMKFQSDYARTAFDQVVAQTSHSTERMMKLAGEVAQPISNRVAIAAEKMKIAA